MGAADETDNCDTIWYINVPQPFSPAAHPKLSDTKEHHKILLHENGVQSYT